MTSALFQASPSWSLGHHGTHQSGRHRPPSPAVEFIPLEEEVKGSPRVLIDIPGQLSLRDSNTLPVVVRGVSPNSVQLSCRRTLLPTLAPVSDEAVAARIWLQLPFRAGPMNLASDCLVRHLGELDAEHGAIGLEFCQSERLDSQMLKLCIEHSARPVR